MPERNFANVDGNKLKEIGFQVYVLSEWIAPSAAAAVLRRHRKDDVDLCGVVAGGGIDGECVFMGGRVTPIRHCRSQAAAEMAVINVLKSFCSKYLHLRKQN